MPASLSASSVTPDASMSVADTIGGSWAAAMRFGLLNVSENLDVHGI